MDSCISFASFSFTLFVDPEVKSGLGISDRALAVSVRQSAKVSELVRKTEMAPMAPERHLVINSPKHLGVSSFSLCYFMWTKKSKNETRKRLVMAVFCPRVPAL